MGCALFPQVGSEIKTAELGVERQITAPKGNPLLSLCTFIHVYCYVTCGRQRGANGSKEGSPGSGPLKPLTCFLVHRTGKTADFDDSNSQG